jgi:UDP-4-amino-4,6-dideoxy-N-acetyl-beta-L-altrosamine N-acetyltransferase
MSVSADKDPLTFIPESVTLIDFTQIDSVTTRMVLKWRNHENIRKWMSHISVIPENEHHAFIKGLSEDSTKRYYVVQIHNEPIGVIDFYRIMPDKNSCYYGYYLKPERIGSSLGLLLEFIAAEYALVKMGLNSLIAETMPQNTHAMELHRRFGFEDRTINSSGLQESYLGAERWMTNREDLSSLVERLTS